MEKPEGAGKRLAFPRFGAVQDRRGRFAEYGLGMEMYWCRRSCFGECQEVRILHASRCLPGAWPEARKIIQHMNGEGFRVKHKRYAGSEFRREWSTADVLLLGCDSREWRRTIEALTEMERGLLGVWRGWDVLWYFADGRVPEVARRHMAQQGGACSNDAFSAEAIRMIRAHAERRHDVVARRGLLVTLELCIADSIDLLVAPQPHYDEFGRKVNRLKNAKKSAKGGGRDWDLFFAAVEFLMETRNRSTHPNVTSSFDNRMEAYVEFKAVARRYGFEIPPTDHGCPIETDSQNRQVLMKLLVALSRMAKAWLDECDKDIWKRSDGQPRVPEDGRLRRGQSGEDPHARYQSPCPEG